jgi:uncharacterized membrane protein YfcA
LDIFILAFAAFFAGFVDAVVGGGGLIQLPALFSVYSQELPARLIGTSKLAGVWGTSVAAVKYVRAVRLPWVVIAPASIIAFLFSFLGAITVTYISPDLLRKALPFMLLAIVFYTLFNKDLGRQFRPRFSGRLQLWMMFLMGAVIGFYDGFFGPGTGSFFIFILVRLFGYDFLHASAGAKVLNVACNLAALIWFGWSGNLLWQVGFAMAVCNVAGSVFGTRMALKHGSGFVRILFLMVVSALLIKTSYDAFLK